MLARRYVKWILVSLICTVIFAIGVVTGVAIRRPNRALRQDLPFEYSYFEVEMALATGDPEQTLSFVDKTLAWYESQGARRQKDETRAFMQRSMILAVRSRTLKALHRDSEAQEAAEDASKACIQAGRKYCDSSKLVEFSRRVLKAAWEPTN